MSRDNYKHEKNTKKDINWIVLIQHTEAEIKTYSEKLSSLRKSLNFFKKQDSLGVPFPVPERGRHKDLS
jgi:hypothetical protein